MLTLPMLVSGFGMFLVILVALPAVILSFIIGPAFWLFATGLTVGAVGALFFLLGIVLKSCSMFFRK